jgi:hypothetical protein
MFVCGVLRHNKLVAEDVRSVDEIESKFGDSDFVVRYLVDSSASTERRPTHRVDLRGVRNQLQQLDVSASTTPKRVASLYVKRYDEPGRSARGDDGEHHPQRRRLRAGLQPDRVGVISVRSDLT